MQNIEELIELVRKNEEIARKLFDIEVQILGITSYDDYFERLLRLVREKFLVEHVWISLIDNMANKAIRAGLADHVAQPVLISAAEFERFMPEEASPLLINQDLFLLRSLIPTDIRSTLGSLAILPLEIEGKLVGSLNLGSPLATRYEPGKDSFFLHQLAVKASISLASVVAHEQVRFLATRDPLTLLRNRREFEEAMEQELSRAQRHGQPLALAFIDCDDFKGVNDTHGHDCGDCYLRHVADQLSLLVRRSDTVFRFAGDEFVILLPNQNLKGAELIAERLRQDLSRLPLRYQDKVVPVRLSIGVACTDELDEWSARRLLTLADQRLYSMKSARANRDAC